MPPQAYLFGDWMVPWVVVVAAFGLIYLWTWFNDK